MKKTYGIKSLLIIYCLFIGVIVYGVFKMSGILHRHPHASRVIMAVYIFYATGAVLTAYILTYSFRRYNFVTIKDNEIRFSSLNPGKKPVVISINDITRIAYVSGRRIEFTINTTNEEIAIAVTINLPEARNFYEEIILKGPHIQLSEPQIELYRSKAFRIWRIISLAIALITLLYICSTLLRHHN